MGKWSGGRDRRGKKRYRRRLKTRVWWDELELTGYTVDISSSGLLLELTAALPKIGTRFHTEVRLGNQDFFTECLVVRHKVYPPQARSVFKPAIGARFVSLTEAIRGEKEGDTPRPELKEEDTPATETAETVPPIVDLRERAELESVYNKDIKHGGLHVHTTVIPELYGDVSVPVLLPDPHGEIECLGTVVKIFDDPPGFAMRLAEVDAVRARLIEIIRSF